MIGTVLDGRYRIERVIGSGGMGAVYEATHVGTGGRVAVKLIQQMALGDTDVWSRFQREARASSAIDTRHIVEVIDSGRDAETGLPFMAMELLKGEDLGAVITRMGKLEPALAVRLVAQACIGIAKAHRAFVVHRDIKPANLFLTEEDEGDEVIVKLLDFGIAKVRPATPVESDGLNLTQTGKLLGTPLYMSPEQAQGLKDIDARTDVWSIGAVLYEALTGRSPFQEADNLGKLILAICSKRPPRPRELAQIPPELDDLVMRCLAIERSERWQSADDLLAALLEMVPEGTRVARGEVWEASGVPTLRTSRPSGLRPSRPSDLKVVPAGSDLDMETTRAVEEAGVASTLYATSQTSAPAGRKKQTAWLVFAAAGLVGVVAAAAAALWGGDEPPQAPSGEPVGAGPTASTAPATNRSTVAVDVVPSDATVIVGGAERPVKAGVLELEGEVGQEIVVTIRKGDVSRKEIVTITANGPRPTEVLLEPPQPAPSATASAAAQAPSAVTAVPTQRPSRPPGAAGNKTPPTAVPVHAPEFE